MGYLILFEYFLILLVVHIVLLRETIKLDRTVCDELVVVKMDDTQLNSPVNYSLWQELYRAEEAKRIL